MKYECIVQAQLPALPAYPFRGYQHDIYLWIGHSLMWPRWNYIWFVMVLSWSGHPVCDKCDNFYNMFTTSILFWLNIRNNEWWLSLKFYSVFILKKRNHFCSSGHSSEATRNVIYYNTDNVEHSYYVTMMLSNPIRLYVRISRIITIVW